MISAVSTHVQVIFNYCAVRFEDKVFTNFVKKGVRGWWGFRGEVVEKGSGSFLERRVLNQETVLAQLLKR